MSGGTLDTRCSVSISDTWLSHCVAGLPRPFSYQNFHVMQVHTPAMLPPQVWPTPISLATTLGISVDVFSSPYLDVSVQAVPPIHLWIQCMVTGHNSGRVSPFGYPRITACFRLPVAFRRSLRPSSAPSAKAFSLRSSSLDLLMLESSQVLTSIPL